MVRLRSGLAYLLFIALLLSGGAAILWFVQFDGIHRMVRIFEDKLTFRLMQGLVFKQHLPRANGGCLADDPVAYILGGTQESLRYKCKTVGRLYEEGAVRKILILHRPGITEYSPELDRNFTNDEWVTMILKDEGVAIGNLEFVRVPPAAFDTFAEARAISALARSRRVKQLVLVSSAHHTKRVWLSFSHFNADTAFEPYIYGSEETPSYPELLMETMKLWCYRYIVFPIDRLRGHFH